MRRGILPLLLLFGIAGVRCSDLVGVGIDFNILRSSLRERKPQGTQAIAPELLRRIEGVYTTVEGHQEFGDSIVVRERGGGVSIFCGTANAAFVVLNAGTSGDTLRMEGYWRYAYRTETGFASLTLLPDEGGRALRDTSLPRTGFILRGAIGSGENAPDRTIRLDRVRDIPADTVFQVMGHRGGGRNSDLHPYSENSVEMIQFAERLGCTGVEIDIQLTLDSVPVLYHDQTINTRLIQGDYLIGPISNYSFNQLRRFARLKQGERIPTLAEALDAIITSTQLREVWLDIKSRDVLRVIQPILASARSSAQAHGRTVEFLSGLPDDDVLAAWQKLPQATRGPSICELSPSIVRSINATVWAPRWTIGAQLDEVRAMHAEGRRAFVWTLDQPVLIAEFLRNGEYDAILTNYPTVLAWHEGMRR